MIVPHEFLCERLGGRPLDSREFPDASARIEAVQCAARATRQHRVTDAAALAVVCPPRFGIKLARRIVEACFHEHGIEHAPCALGQDLDDGYFFELVRDGRRGVACVQLQDLPTGERLVILDVEFI